MKKVLIAFSTALLLCGCVNNKPVQTPGPASSAETAAEQTQEPAAEKTAEPSAAPETETASKTEQLIPDTRADSDVSNEPVVITNPVDLDIYDAHPDMSGYQFLDDDEPAFAEITAAESIRMFSEGGSGILFYSQENCHYCQRACPLLNEAAKEKGITVYYIDAMKDILPGADSKTNQRLFNELCSYIYPIFRVTDGVRQFRVPEVIAVKEGQIMGHKLTLTDDYVMVDESTQMTAAQKEELKNIYLTLIALAADE